MEESKRIVPEINEKLAKYKSKIDKYALRNKTDIVQFVLKDLNTITAALDTSTAAAVAMQFGIKH